MNTYSFWRKMISAVVSLSLWLQLWAPAFALAPIQASAKATAPMADMLPVEVVATTPSLTPTLPKALTTPVTMARVQSRYQTGNNVVITYTISNNQIPSQLPAIMESTPVTDAVAILNSFTLTDDLNTLRTVILTDSLAANVTYLDSTTPPEQIGNHLTWHLADIPPGATAVFTLTLQPPATAADFTELDSGLTLNATLWDMPLTATARPAMLAPDTIDPATLASTADVDIYDKDMLWRTGAVFQDPIQAFDLVREMAYHPYVGSLRGTRGTLWGAAGNSIDQASLLIAALRAAGIPARYRHGTLDQADTQQLVAAMFPPAPGLAGYIPADTETADPLNDPQLLTLVQDHWWVEAYLPSQGWTNLDPSFPQATVGQQFATPVNDGSDQIAELPAELRHTLHFNLIVERYSEFPIGGVFLNRSTPLSVTLPTAQVAGKRLSLSHFVKTEKWVGNVQHTYEPFLGIEENDVVYVGDAWSDLLTLFPLASTFTTAEWLEYQVTSPDGYTQHFTRTVKDLYGPAARLGVGVPELAVGLETPPFTHLNELFVNWVLPHSVPDWAYIRQANAQLPQILAIGDEAQNALDVAAYVTAGNDPTPEQLDSLVTTYGRYVFANNQLYAVSGLRFARDADAALAGLEQGLQTKLFYSQPRLFAIGVSSNLSGTLQTTVDLRTTQVETIVYPGQAITAANSANWLKGVLESQLEGAVLESIYGETPLTTAALFDSMQANNIAPVLFTPDRAYLLDVYPYPEDSRALMLEALLEGKTVLAPSAPVPFGDEETLAWWEIDPETGETISVGPDGLHLSLVEWTLAKLLAEQLIEQIIALFVQFFTGGTLSTGGGYVALAEGLLEVGMGIRETMLTLADAIGRSRAPLSDHDQWRYLPDHLCPIDNCGIGQFLLADVSVSPMPLPEMAFVYQQAETAVAFANTSIAATATLPPGDPTFTLNTNPASSSTTPDQPITFQVEIDTNFDDTFNTSLYAPDGWHVTLDPNGQVTAHPPVGATPANYTLLLVSQSTLHPQLSATTQHIVTITPFEGMALTLTPEPNLTIPMGQAFYAAASNQTNDGEAEIPQAAYTIHLTNTATVSHTFVIDVTGPPSDWIILSSTYQDSTTVTLPPGGKTDIGLYLLPPPDTLPTPGTSYVVDVTATATENPGLNANDSDLFTMPSQAFNYIDIEPDTIYVTANSNSDLTLSVTNVGNVAGNFPLTATVPVTTWTISQPQPVNALAVGETVTQTLNLSIGEATVGYQYPLQVSGPAPNSYRQYAFADVQVVSLTSFPFFEAAASCTLGEPSVAAALESLALAVVELERWCDLGDCPLPLRDQVVDAANSVADYVDGATLSIPLTTTATIRAIATDLASHTSDEDILADLSNLGPAMTALSADLCQVEQHRVAAQFTPYVTAVLLGEPATFTLEVSNRGSLTTTYTITFTGLPGPDTNFNQTIPPGQTIAIPVTPTLTTPGAYDLTADVVAIAPNLTLDIGDTAVARLNAVSKFVQVIQVMATPAFVDTGVSSTTVSVEIANIANVPQDVTARTAVYAPGGSLQYTQDISLTLLAGNPRHYPLTSLNTSAWAEGIYTITVNLLDSGHTLIPDGSGYTYLSVGQSLIAHQLITPTLVPPGDVTVTTYITTALTNPSLGVEPLRPPMPATTNNTSSYMPHHLPTSLTPAARSIPQEPPLSFSSQPVIAPQSTINESALMQPNEASSIIHRQPSSNDYSLRIASNNTGEEIVNRQSLIVNSSYTRTEQTASSIVYTGTWSSVNNNRISGSYYRADDPGDAFTFTFDGTWFSLGFYSDRYSGQAELFLDGTSQGILDLYRRDDSATSYYYGDLVSTTHTISLTVLGTANANALNDRVQFDYIDSGNDTDLPDGTFEQDDPRVLLSNGWGIINDSQASGGSYIRDDTGSVWFPFSGDSFSFHTVHRSGNGWTQLHVDGRYLTTLYTFNFDTFTQTYSFEGFGPGPHILQVSGYRNNSTVDAFTTPGTAPFTDPTPAASGYTRYEEDHPAWLYNGQPFTQTATSWTRSTSGVAGRSSRGQVVYSEAAGDTAAITVNGQWLNLGLSGDSNGGQAEIFLDGVSQGLVDLYRRDDTVTSKFFPNLISGTHTISLTVLGDGDVWIDYLDVWDGNNLPDGIQETFPDDRFYLSNNWSRRTDNNAENGNHYTIAAGTAWFPFTGDSVTYHAFAYSGADMARLYLDDTFVGNLDLFNYTDISRTFSFDGLGSGVHLLRLESHYGIASLETFATPGTAPFYTPPPTTGVYRYEEDHPALRYNGLPLTQTNTTWTDESSPTFSSGGHYLESRTVGDSVSLTFTGPWVGLGFLSHTYGGQVDVYLDGVYQQTVDTYNNYNDTSSVYFSDLPDTTHTISFTLIVTTHPNARANRIYFDYIDVWDGTTLPDGTFEETDSRILFSKNWTQETEADAGGGTYVQDGLSNNATAWFPFTGDSVSYHAWAARANRETIIKVDGRLLDHVNLFSDIPMSRTLSFDGFGPGAHMLEVRSYRGNTTVDAFTAPGITPFYTPPPAPTGVIRYEEDHPDLRYNGYPLTQTAYTWASDIRNTSSGGYVARTSTDDHAVSLDFYGHWVGVGFGTPGGVADIFIDGSLAITVDTSIGQNVTSVYFDNLITGSHTISVSRRSGTLYFDFIDAWDGSQMGDGWFEPDLDQYNGPFYYSNLPSWTTVLPESTNRIAYARNDDVIGRSRISSNTHLWFTFTGDDLTFLPFNRDGRAVELYIDGLSQGIIDLTPDYSAQPTAFHFSDLGDGPHTAYVNAVDFPYIDAFEVNPDQFLPYTPIVEWQDMAPTDTYTDTYSNGGLLSSVALGDLQGDGVVELVVPASNGQLYVYRGDGQDAGGGSPLLWQSDLVGSAAEPALADLDNDGLAEIIVAGSDGTAAFHHDGSLYWFTDTIKSGHSEGGFFGWGGPSLANLDLEPGPEIVIAANGDALYVLDHDGRLLFTDPIGGNFPTVPTLADISGDGIPDILMAQDRTLTAYDYFNGGNILWTRSHTYTGFYGQAFGAPAVADIDGKQPGGDDGPEVVINWGHYIDVLDADGTFLWHYNTNNNNYRRPSPITIADVDGDNEIEILTASARQSGFLVFEHTLFALKADGSLLWQQSMGDTSASASGVATQDLNGDGIWEVIWNGLNEGFTVMNGPDGEKLFNEEFTESGTIVDYPAVGDVDGDGYAEIVTGGRNGLFVLGHDQVWAMSRPLWNQHNYHITNINDDWSIPVSEPNSWDVHNTYRTQTPERNPAPSYQIALTYTSGITGVTLLTDTASITLTATPPTYTWDYRQEWYQPIITTSFASFLPAMQPGEVRQVAAGTDIVYRLPTGINQLTLPPLYATAPRIITIAPAAVTQLAGQTAVFTLTLTNPATSADTYTLTLAGPLAEQLAPFSVVMPANSQVALPFTLTIPANSRSETLPVIVDVGNSNNGRDSATAALTIQRSLSMAISPVYQAGPTYRPLTYTLLITNLEGVAHTYDLTAHGLAAVSLPPAITVPIQGITLPFTVTPTQAGPQPFTVEMRDGMISASANAIAEGNGRFALLASLTPATATAGPGSTTPLSLTLTNLGSLPDRYHLSASLPAGWAYSLQQAGNVVDSVTIPAAVFNQANLTVLVTPPATVSPGTYPITVRAYSPQSGVEAIATATLQVGTLGVQISLTPAQQAVDPETAVAWQVTLTNTGSSADSYDLVAAGLPLAGATFTPATVSLNPGQSQTVVLNQAELPPLLPQPYPLAVAATSQSDAQIAAEATGLVKVNPVESVAVDWLPLTRTVTNSLTTELVFIITNTGNINTPYLFEVEAAPTATVQLDVTSLPLPAHATAFVRVALTAPAPGSYALVGTASSPLSMADASATVVFSGEAPLQLEAGDDVNGVEGTAVAFEASATGSGSQDLTIRWQYGDGSSSSGSLTPSHTYADNGIYPVTLTVTSTTGLVLSDHLVATIDNLPPTVEAGDNQTIGIGQLLTFNGSFTDPGSLDTHTILWDFDDGNTASGSLTPSHAYAVPGTYTVRLTITDNSGASNSDTLTVIVNGGLVYIPIFYKDS